jgi:hypothetical protein
MARFSPPTDWHALKTDADWKAHPGGVIVVHQRTPLGDEAPTKYHGRNCGWVQHGSFRERVARGTDNSEWFRARRCERCTWRGGCVRSLSGRVIARCKLVWH